MYVLSTARLEVFGDILMSKIEAKLGLDASAKRLIELINATITNIGVELRE